MITVKVEAPYATFRKSYARSYAETYPLPPPATVYGMLLSLVGERFRSKHEGVGLGLAFSRIPRIATTLRKLSRYKYGVASKQSSLGNAPDYIETVCGLEFLCWIDSSTERCPGEASLEARISQTLNHPSAVKRYGIVCLGLSDDAVNEIKLLDSAEGEWMALLQDPVGNLELPIWVDHVGSAGTRWRRFKIDSAASISANGPPPLAMMTISQD